MVPTRHNLGDSFLKVKTFLETHLIRQAKLDFWQKL